MLKISVVALLSLSLARIAAVQAIPPSPQAAHQAQAPQRTMYKVSYLGMPFEEWLNIDGMDATVGSKCAETRDKKLKKECEAYDQFKQTVRSGHDAQFPMPHPEMNMASTYIFRAQKLANIKLVFSNQIAGYETQLLNLIGKYGSPTKTDSTTMQNGYGASWNVRSARWEMPDGAVIALNEGTDREHSITFVEFQSKEEVIRAQAATKQQLQSQNPY